MLLGTGQNLKGTRTSTIDKGRRLSREKGGGYFFSINYQGEKPFLLQILRNFIFRKKNIFEGQKVVFITVFKAERIKSNTNLLSSISDTVLEEFIVAHPTLGHCRMVLGVRPCN